MTQNREKRKTSSREGAAIYQKGLAAFETGRFADAIDLLSKIADCRDLSGTLGRFYLGQAHMQFGIREMQAGRHDSATEHLSAARRINPDSADLWRYLSACHIGRGRFDLAAAEFEKARQSGDPPESVPIRLAYALLRDGQLDRAVQSLEESIGEQPERADLRFHLGLIHASTDGYEAAAEALLSAVALAPNDALIHQHFGLTQAMLGNVRQAVEHLSRAQRIRPRDSHLMLLLTMAMKAAKEAGESVTVQPAQVTEASISDASIRELGEIIAEDPDFVEAFIRLPESLVDPEIFATLAGILEQALDLHPDYADLHYHCSRVYERLGRTESAIVRANRAIGINPRYVQALIQLGRLYANVDEHPAAVDRLQAAIECGGDYPDVHFMLGELHREDGDTQRACYEYETALELNSGYSQARQALEAVLTA